MPSDAIYIGFSQDVAVLKLNLSTGDLLYKKVIKQSPANGGLYADSVTLNNIIHIPLYNLMLIYITDGNNIHHIISTTANDLGETN